MKDSYSSRGGGFSPGGRGGRGGRGGGGNRRGSGRGGRGGGGGRGRGRGGFVNGSNNNRVLASANTTSSNFSSSAKPQRHRRHSNDVDAIPSVKLAKSRGGLDQQILNVYVDDDQADMEDMELDVEDGDVRPVTKTIGGNKFKLSEVASSDDEEIDEDDAFDSEDEDRFAGFKFYGGPSDGKKKSKSHKRGGDSDSDAASNASDSDSLSLDDSADDNASGSDDDDDSDATDTEDFVDLSEMLGSNAAGSSDDEENDAAEPEHVEQPSRGKKRRMPESDSDSDNSANDDDDASSASGDDDSDDDAMDQDFIRPDELPSSDEDRDSDDAMDTDGDDAYAGDIGDLITKLLDAKKSKSDAEGGPRKKRKLAEERTEAYAEGEFALPTRGSGRLDLGMLVSALAEEKDLGKVKGQAVRLRTDNEESKREAAPLPAREKARIERQAGYSTVAEEVDRYQLLVERNRNAANLHFDLVDERASQSTAAMVSDFKPASKLDKAIASIVDDSQFDDNKTMGLMELPDHVLDKDEIARRQKELRWMRELAFRQELKAKRHAKIKSKSFRKILKKERERTKEEDLQRLLESDPDAAREHLIKLELDRAKARMTQKGKLKNKWTAMMARNGELAERSAGLSREQILDQIKEAEDLQKRIHGVGNDDSDSDADPRNHGGNADSGDGASDDDDDLPTKGVFGMKFMQRAAEAEAVRQANAGRDDFDGIDADEKDQVVGRRTVGSGINPAGIVVGNDEPVIESALAEPTPRSANNKQQKKQPASSHQVSAADITFTVNTGSDDGGAEDNPWAASGTGIDRSAASSKLGKLQKKQQKQLATMAARADASEGKSKPVLDLDVVNTVVAAHHDSDDDSDADVDGARRAGTGKAGGSRVAFKQTELVSMAFAGDDVVREFEEEKMQLEDAEAGKVVDLTLPGWGSWGGEGLKAKTNVVVKKIAGVDKDKRKDSGMGHVIISEKRQKKLTKYMATSVPHPYQSRAQYEAAMRQTIGKEWVTSESMSALTMPKITKAQGVVIKPLKFNKSEAEAWGEKKRAARSENNKLAVKKKKKEQQKQQQQGS